MTTLEPKPEPGHSSLTQCDLTVFATLRTAEPMWRRFEQIAVLTPYQRFDWVEGLLAAGAEPDGRIAIVFVMDGRDPVAMLPLAIETRFGARRAKFLGTHQSNIDWLATAPGFVPDPEAMRTLLTKVSTALGGIDIVSVHNQPVEWQGVASSLLALARQPAASNLYTKTIGSTALPYIEHGLTHKRRTNIKRGRRRLEEMFGPVRLVRVSDTPTLDLVHQAFLDQRGERFDQMGVSNIFAGPVFVKFFRALAKAGFDQHRPALVFHALYAGETIVATTCGTMAGQHYSQYINSTASGPASKYSLMGILIAELMDELVATGIETFDMGLGDFEYKTDWTDPEPVYHSIIALSARGRALVSFLAGGEAIKRSIKQTPALWRIAQNLRRTLHRVRRG